MLLLLLLLISDNNYYIMPSHMHIRMHFLDLMNIHVQVFLHFIMHVTLIGLLQLPVVINIVS